MGDLSGLMAMLLGIAVVSAGIGILYQNYQKIEEMLGNKLSESLDRLGDPKLQPFRKVFHQYQHRSAELWYEWIRGQDKAVKDIAFDKLLDYLDSPLEKLGSVTVDAIKTVLAFKREKSFSAITNLLKKARKAWGQYKTVEVFYEKAVVGLALMNSKDAEKFILAELEIAKHKNDFDSLLLSLMKAIEKLEHSEPIEAAVLESVTENLLKFDVKKQALGLIEKYDLETQKRMYFKIFKKYLSSSSKILEENEDKIIEIVLSKLKKYTSVDFDQEIWSCILEAAENEKLVNITSNFLCDVIHYEDQIEAEQLADLLKLKEPGRTKYTEAMANRNKLNEKELALLKNHIKKEHIEFETKSFNIEKSKKTMTVASELAGEYHRLEQIFIGGAAIKNDKNNGVILIISGDAEIEKLYLLRALAANSNIAFAYIDSFTLINAPDLMMTLSNTLNNNKPCITYIDNLDTTLSKKLEKSQAQHLKDINKIIKELCIIPNMLFIGNISHSKENLKATVPDLDKAIKNSSHGNYKIIHEINKPDIKDRRRVFQNFQQKLQDKRTLDSEGFSVDALLGATEGFSLIDYQLFLEEFFEISLLIFGALISMPEFLKHAHRSERLFQAFTQFETDDLNDDAESEDIDAEKETEEQVV